VHRRFHDVLQGREVREKVEALEYHPDGGPLGSQLVAVQIYPVVLLIALADDLAIDVDAATGRLFKMIDAAKQRALARS
jgi:hypothetical protein